MVESKETQIYHMLRRIKDDKVKDPFQDMLRRINVVESKATKFRDVKKDKR